MDAGLKISRAKTKLAIEQPFWGSCALELKSVENNTITTFATDGRSLLWNRTYVDSLSEELVRNIIIHEVEHVLKKHHIRMVSLKGDKKDHKKWNYATDHIINTMMHSVGFNLPEGALMDFQYANMNAEKVYSIIPEPPEGDEGGMIGEVMPMPGSQGETPSKADISDENMKIDQMICRAVDNAEKSQGTVPGYAQELLKKIRKPKKNWQDTIFTAIAARGFTDFTMSRPNRRLMANYDMYLPSMYTNKIGKIGVALDSSGSMSTKDLQLGLGLIQRIKEDYNPEAIIVIEVDAQVHEETVLLEHDKITEMKIKGRGGTLVTPAFKYFDKHHPDIDTLLYITDLYVNDIPSTPPLYPVIWMCVSDEATAPWGLVVRIGEE